MAVLAALVGLFVASLGGLGIAFPSQLIVAVARFQSQRGIYVLGAVRICLGVVLLLAAADSRAPVFLGVLGVLALIAGTITSFFGVQQFEATLSWWSRKPAVFLRSRCAVLLGLGLGVIWAVSTGTQCPSNAPQRPPTLDSRLPI